MGNGNTYTLLESLESPKQQLKGKLSVPGTRASVSIWLLERPSHFMWHKPFNTHTHTCTHTCMHTHTSHMHTYIHMDVSVNIYANFNQLIK